MTSTCRAHKCRHFWALLLSATLPAYTVRHFCRWRLATLTPLRYGRRTLDPQTRPCLAAKVKCCRRAEAFPLLRPDRAPEVRALLNSPRRLCEALDLLDGAKPQSQGLSVRCPVHGEKRPSLSITLGPDGTIRCVCFACGFRGDALALIAAVRGAADFAEALAIGAEIAGHFGLRDEIRDGVQLPERPSLAKASPPPEKHYPSASDVERLWDGCASVCSDADAWELLRGRAIAPELVDDLGLARCLKNESWAPWWASYERQGWAELGHRLLLPLFDGAGTLRSVRAWRVEGGDTPSRLPAAGVRSAWLALANGPAVAMLRRELCPLELLIVEGEPDYLTAATEWPDSAVIGIGSGWWGQEHADAIPSRTRVTIATHPDLAGDRYAAEVLRTIENRAPVFRWRVERAA